MCQNTVSDGVKPLGSHSQPLLMLLGNEFHFSHSVDRPQFIILFCNFPLKPASFLSLEVLKVAHPGFIGGEQNNSPLLRNKWKAASQLNEAQQSLITC